jgi:chitin disaccharide deacetylase
MSGGGQELPPQHPSPASRDRTGLIVNADDFGLSGGVNAGIMAAHEHGIVTSASLMVRWPAAREAARYAAEHPRMSLGLHLDLGEWAFTQGEWKAIYEVVPGESSAAVVAEVRKQLRQFHDIVGHAPSHVDSHQHVHRGEPARTAALEIGAEMGVPVRFFARHIQYCGQFYGQDGRGEPWLEGISREGLLRLLGSLPPGITELGCHPGWDDDLRTMYCHERRLEVDVLCDPQVAAAIERLGIRCISFTEVTNSLEAAKNT